MVASLKNDTARWDQERRRSPILDTPRYPGAHAPGYSMHEFLKITPGAEPFPTSFVTFAGNSKVQQAASVLGGDPDSGYASASRYDATIVPESIAHGNDMEDSQDLASDFHTKQDYEDLATEYSVASNLNDDRFSIYKDELADNLSRGLEPLDLDMKTREHIADVMPGLLKQFALRVGQGSTEKAERELMFFVHKYRK